MNDTSLGSHSSICPSLAPSLLPHSLLLLHCTLLFPLFFLLLSTSLSVSLSSPFSQFPPFYFLFPVSHFLIPFSCRVALPSFFLGTLLLQDFIFLFLHFLRLVAVLSVYTNFLKSIKNNSTLPAAPALFSVPQTFPTCLYSGFLHIDILSRDPPRVLRRQAACPRATPMRAAAAAAAASSSWLL